MKKIIFIFSILLVSSSSWGVLPPKYLSVPEWQSCVSTVTKGGANFVCLPAEKPLTCPQASWDDPSLREIEVCP